MGVCPNQVLPGLGTSATQLAPHILRSIGEDFYTSYSEDEHATTSPTCQRGLKLLMQRRQSVCSLPYKVPKQISPLQEF